MTPIVHPEGAQPPPCWFAEFYPFFPLFMMGPRRPRQSQRPEDVLPCTLGHRQALEVAQHVRTVLGALVALGHFDVRMFLDLYLRSEGGGSDPPGKYLTYLRGQRPLLEANRVRLDRAIEDLATSRFIWIVVPNDVPGEGIRARRPFRDLHRVAAQVERMPLLMADFLYLDGSHISNCLPLVAGKRTRLIGWANLWTKVVEDQAVELGLSDQCRCHTLQRMYETGSPGPPSELDIKGRGGSGPNAARRRPHRE